MPPDTWSGRRACRAWGPRIGIATRKTIEITWDNGHWLRRQLYTAQQVKNILPNDAASFSTNRHRAYRTTFTARLDIFEKALKEGRTVFDLHCHKFLFHGDYEYYRFPIVFRQYAGKYLRDFLDLGYPPICLVSNRVVDLLRENKITGWDKYPITLYVLHRRLQSRFAQKENSHLYRSRRPFERKTRLELATRKPDLAHFWSRFPYFE